MAVQATRPHVKKTKEQMRKQYAKHKSPYVELKKSCIATRRVCLACDILFPSVSIGQRLCKTCRGRAENSL